MASAAFQHLVIKGGRPLSGTVTVHGAKNAVLVSMTAALLADGVTTLQNVPFSADVAKMTELLSAFGVKVTCDPEGQQVHIDTRQAYYTVAPEEAVRAMRASVLIMGPSLARFKKAVVSLPGGCVLGARPLDLHLQALSNMGVSVIVQEGAIRAHVEQLSGCDIVFKYPSVGATENILMAATAACGATRLINAALEPEVLNLIAMLQAMGAHIRILPGQSIEIEGGHPLTAITHTIIMDRLEAGTLLLAGAITGGTVTVKKAPVESMRVFLQVLQDMGHDIICDSQTDTVTLKAAQRPRSVSFKTLPYPGFPTDLQAPTIAALSLADGNSCIEETVYENRLIHVRELVKMGAQITVHGTQASLVGVERLYGASLIGPDIRGTAGLLLAALAAQGESTLSGIHHLYRGYENIIEQLISLGASIDGRL